MTSELEALVVKTCVGVPVFFFAAMAWWIAAIYFRQDGDTLSPLACRVAGAFSLAVALYKLLYTAREIIKAAQGWGP